MRSGAESRAAKTEAGWMKPTPKSSSILSIASEILRDFSISGKIDIWVVFDDVRLKAETET